MPKNIDSKFRLITIAAKRCEQLHHGAKPRLETRSKKWAFVALQELKKGLVEFEIIDTPVETDVEEYDSDVFLEGDMGVIQKMDPVPQVDIEDEDTGVKRTDDRIEEKLEGNKQLGDEGVLEEEAIEEIEDMDNGEN